MTRYTVCVAYDLSYAATVTVEADTPEDACRRAIDRADELEAWKSTDHSSDAYVVEIAGTFDPGTDAEETVPLPVPRRLHPRGTASDGHLPRRAAAGLVRSHRRHGEVPFRPPRLRRHDRGQRPAAPSRQQAPGHRFQAPGRHPRVSVTGGKAHVRVTGWDDGG